MEKHITKNADSKKDGLDSMDMNELYMQLLSKDSKELTKEEADLLEQLIIEDDAEGGYFEED